MNVLESKANLVNEIFTLHLVENKVCPEKQNVTKSGQLD